MSCEICGRGSCTRSFHSLSEQEEFDTKTGRYAPDDDDEVELAEKQNEILSSDLLDSNNANGYI